MKTQKQELKMKTQRHNRAVAALAVLALSAPAAAGAQTVVNLSNYDTNIAALINTTQSTGGPLYFNATTNLDLLNNSTALSTGGTFGAALNMQQQQGNNLLNSIGVNPSTGAVQPVVFGTGVGLVNGVPTVEINTVTSAYRTYDSNIVNVGSIEHYTPVVTGTTSMTVFNNNIATNVGLNTLYGSTSGLGNFGAGQGGAQAGGSQVGSNTANAVGAAFADGTAVNLNQLPAAPQIVNSGSSWVAGAGVSNVLSGGDGLNMSVVNSLIAATFGGPAIVNGSTANDANGAPIVGNQIAANSFNTASLYGGIAATVQQKGDGLTPASGFQAANQAFAYSANAAGANVDPAVMNLNQTASTTINSLTLGSASSTTAGQTLGGKQSLGDNHALYNVTSNWDYGAPVPVMSNQIVASTLSPGSTFNPGIDTIAIANFGSAFVGGGYNLGTGNVTASNVGQAMGTFMNTVQTGANPITTDARGFSQNMTDTVLVGGTSLGYGTPAAGAAFVQANPAALDAGQLAGTWGQNGIIAETGAGVASIASAQQSYQVGLNTFNSGANITGTVSQNMRNSSNTDYALSFLQTSYAGSGGDGGYRAYGGPSIGNGPLGSANGYAIEGANAVFNTASALAIAGGAAQVSNLSQQSQVVANQLATTGSLAGGASGAITQIMGKVATSEIDTSNYAEAHTPPNWNSNSPPAVNAPSVVGSSAAQNFASAMIGYSYYAGNTQANNGVGGTASVTGLVQKQTTAFNQISATGVGGASGNIQQSSTDIVGFPEDGSSTYDGKFWPIVVQGSFLNAAQAINNGRGNAILGGQQSNVAMLNTVNASTLGSGSAPIALTQDNAGIGQVVGNANVGTAYGSTAGTSVAPYGTAIAPLAIGNTAVAYAAANGAQAGSAQTAGFMLNNVAATGSMVGSLNQASNGAGVMVSNAVQAMQGNYSPSNIGGNVVANPAQFGFTSLNTAALGGAVNGSINQVTYKATNFGVNNTAAAFAANGAAVSVGSQVAQNTVNVITVK